MEDNNIYVKQKNGRYKPYGMRCDENYLGDGIWYVRHREHSFGTTNVDYMAELLKIGDVQKPIDIPKVCSIEEYCDYILDSIEFNEMVNKGFSLNDLVHKLVALILEKNEEAHK